MPSFSRVILVGNLTRDPELRHIATGTAVTDIGLAINDRRKLPSGEWVEDVTFVDITLWGRTAEVVCQYLTKGAPLLVEGRLKLDSWEADGQKRSKLKVVGERIEFLNSGGSGASANLSSGSAANSSPSRPVSRLSTSPEQDYYEPPTDDVPF
ncbi:MAG: single-stranded DNA-binding protein [Planctomycetaceae bacterium]|jgi:single-strand DNA-binding protein|nr:single-stranded DNA-binding protein [Planctomycetaceae bacterium]